MKHSELRHQPRHVNPRIQDINKMQNRIKIMRFCNAVIADLYEKSNLKKSLNKSHKSWNPLNKRLPRLFAV